MAKEFLAILNTEKWAQCKSGELQEFQTSNWSDNAITLVTREDPTLHQNGYESFARFDVIATDRRCSGSCCTGRTGWTAR